MFLYQYKWALYHEWQPSVNQMEPVHKNTNNLSNGRKHQLN